MTLPDPFLPQLYKVGRTVRELSDVVTLELAPLSGQRPAFTPGQFNMLYVFGVGEVAISMSGDPSETSKIVHPSMPTMFSLNSIRFKVAWDSVILSLLPDELLAELDTASI